MLKILSKKALIAIVLYSPQNIARLEMAGQFPKRVRLGPNRVGWLEQEVLDWLEEHLQRREYRTAPMEPGRPSGAHTGSSSGP